MSISDDTPSVDATPLPRPEYSDGVAARPGPQPHNQIGTLRDQVAKVMAGRPSPRDRAKARLVALLCEDIRDLISETLADELPAALGFLLSSHTSGRATDG